MITVKTYIKWGSKYNRTRWKTIKVCLFGFIPLFVKKVEVD